MKKILLCITLLTATLPLRVYAVKQSRLNTNDSKKIAAAYEQRIKKRPALTSNQKAVRAVLAVGCFGVSILTTGIGREYAQKKDPQYDIVALSFMIACMQVIVGRILWNEALNG